MANCPAWTSYVDTSEVCGDLPVDNWIDVTDPANWEEPPYYWESWNFIWTGSEWFSEGDSYYGTGQFWPNITDSGSFFYNEPLIKSMRFTGTLGQYNISISINYVVGLGGDYIYLDPMIDDIPVASSDVESGIQIIRVMFQSTGEWYEYPDMTISKIEVLPL